MKQVSYTGDGTTTSFNFSFSFFDVNDINVSVGGVLQTADDFELYPLTTSSDPDYPYAGGRIEFQNAPAVGKTVKIWRSVKIVRHTDYQATAQIQPKLLNWDFNQIIEMLGEQDESITNALSLAQIPTLQELLSTLTEIEESLDGFATTTALATLGDTVDGHTSAINTLNGYDYVIESQLPTADNNYTWYRKYKSGWVEQGGIISATATYSTKNIPVAMSNTNYNLICNTNEQFSGNNYSVAYISSVSSFIYKYSGSGTATCCWQISGIAA